MSAAKDLQSIVQDLFSQLGFADAQVVIEPQDESTLITVQVPSDASGVLIGYHGETINSLQLILNLLVYHHTGTWTHLTLNINDYRQRREQSLQQMALSAADQARSTGQEVVMPPMGSYDRRLIHMALGSEPDIATESIGEGRNRRLVVSLKK